MSIELYELVGRDDRRFSPYCWRIRMALEHKQLEYKTIPIRFTDKHLLKFSGQNKVPIIRDGDNVVSDSWKIARYLERSYIDRPSLFGGQVEEAWASFLNIWVDQTLHTALIKLVIADIMEHVLAADQSYFLESRTARFGKSPVEVQTQSRKNLRLFDEVKSTLRSALGTNKFLAGTNPSYKDYIVFGAFAWVRAISDFVLLDREDPIYVWRGRMLQLFDGMPAKSKGYQI